MNIVITLPSFERIKELTDPTGLELYLWCAGENKRELDKVIDALVHRLKELKGK